MVKTVTKPNGDSCLLPTPNDVFLAEIQAFRDSARAVGPFRQLTASLLKCAQAWAALRSRPPHPDPHQR